MTAPAASAHPDASGEPSRPARIPRLDRLRAQGGALGTMLVVTGLFATAALPAYAVMEQRSEPVAPIVAQGPTQSFGVSAAATVATAVRDAFSATTHEELAEQRRQAAIVAGYSYRVPVSNHQGDDYPWAGLAGSLSPLRYYYGECVDFVAWRLNRDAGVTGAPWAYTWGNLTPGGGSAFQWQSAWRNNGWPISSTPIVGAVADTGGNHVAYVSAVYGNGTVLLEEYNYGTDHAYGQRVISAGAATYLYPPG